VTGKDGERTAKGFDSVGRTIPTEMLPGEVIYQGMRFKLADGKNGPANAVACRGQEVELPSGRFSRLLLLAAADGDQRASFRTGDRVFDLLIQDWGGFIGQWDNRIWQAEASPATAPGEKTRKNQPALICTGLKPGFIKPAAVAWFASHRHTAEGANDPYAYAYLFAYELGLPARAKSLRLPNNPRIRILAITAVDKDWALQPLRPIGEDLQVRAP
jgi:alpha-mannosidase